MKYYSEDAIANYKQRIANAKYQKLLDIRQFEHETILMAKQHVKNVENNEVDSYLLNTLNNKIIELGRMCL